MKFEFFSRSAEKPSHVYTITIFMANFPTDIYRLHFQGDFYNIFQTIDTAYIFRQLL